MSKKTTILYVDDEPTNLMLFEQLFKTKYQVLTAESGYKGLKLLTQRPDIHVIISDMKMPGMNGLEFIQESKKLYPSILYFILTGYEITEEIQESLENGLISKYFQKPFLHPV